MILKASKNLFFMYISFDAEIIRLGLTGRSDEECTDQIPWLVPTKKQLG